MNAWAQILYLALPTPASLATPTSLEWNTRSAIFNPRKRSKPFTITTTPSTRKCQTRRTGAHIIFLLFFFRPVIFLFFAIAKNILFAAFDDVERTKQEERL